MCTSKFIKRADFTLSALTTKAREGGREREEEREEGGKALNTYIHFCFKSLRGKEEKGKRS